MKQDPSNILKEALKLPPERRAALAGALLDSVDQELDQGCRRNLGSRDWPAATGPRFRRRSADSVVGSPP